VFGYSTASHATDNVLLSPRTAGGRVLACFPTRRSSDLTELPGQPGGGDNVVRPVGVEVGGQPPRHHRAQGVQLGVELRFVLLLADRKSTRLNSSHVSISYAVFCLKKKRTTTAQTTRKCA